MTDTMYASPYYTFHDPSVAAAAGEAPLPPAGSYLGQPHYIPHPTTMTDPNVFPHHPYPPHPHHQGAPRMPGIQIASTGPSRLRLRRELESRAAPTPIITADMTPEEEAIAREEARKARKREMGRERQRRKRLRDKAKREAEKMRERMEAGGHMSELGMMHPSAMSIPYAPRATSSARSSLSSLSVGSYDSVSSASTGYSTLPPMAMLSPSNSLAMSTSSTSYSDASSPSQSFSPALSATNSVSGFASDSSWNEHAAVFGNLSLSGDADATVRVKAPRGSVNLGGITAPRRTSEPDHGVGSSSYKRRKSDLDDEQSPHVLGVDEWQARMSGSSKQRRPVSVPDGIGLESGHGSSRSHSRSPPPSDQRPPHDAASPEGVYFANSVVQGLNETQWGGMLHTKLGIQHDDLTRMGPGIAGVYDKWRVEHNMNHYFVDPEARVQVMPSHQSPPTMSPRSPSSLSSHATGTMHLGQAQPATPMSQPGESSTATSPVNPSFQMPGQPPFFTSSPQWATAPHLTRGYDPEWDRGYAHTLANPMAHNPNPHPHIAVQTEFVNPEFQTPGPSRGPGAGSAPFTPATPVPQRGHNMAGPPGVPLYYNPQLQQPQPAQQTAQPQQPAPQAPATGPGSPPQTGSSPKPIDPFVMHQQRQ